MVFFYAKIMNSKLLYLEEVDFVSKAYYSDFEAKIYSVKSEVNKLANKYLFSILEYKRLIRKVTDLKNKIPIYFSKSLLLFYVRCDNVVYWINFCNILKVCYEEKIYVIFKCGKILKLDVSISVLKRELVKIEKVLDYINNL